MNKLDELLNFEAIAREHGGVPAFIPTGDTVEGEETFRAVVFKVDVTHDGKGLALTVIDPKDASTRTSIVRTDHFDQALGEAMQLEEERDL